jgi:hypothetical protein
MGAKSWELRATTSLARLLRDREQRDEACTMLAEIYNWLEATGRSPAEMALKSRLRDILSK